MSVRAWARDHVVLATAACAVASLALVFSAALGLVPPGTLPRAPAVVLDAIPPLNAVVSLVALAFVLAGWRAIRRGRIQSHRRRMLTAAGLFATFLALYLYRVALLGPTEFPGTGAVETLYHLLLGVHVVLAVVCIPLLYYVLLLAATRPVEEIPETNHRRVGRVAAPLWALSFALGVAVYLVLYVVY